MLEVFNNGGPVMYPLLACSVIALTVIIDRVIFWVKLELNRNATLVDEILEIGHSGSWDAIKTKASGSKDYIIRILNEGVLNRDTSLVKAMEAAAAEEIRKMQRYMGVLDTMITVAPLLGIFGTVIGIILSFKALGTTGIDHPQAVTAGIAQALITTAAGLGIAIFTVFPYNYFNSRIKYAALAIEKQATRLEIVLEGQIEEASKSKEARI